MHCLKVAGGKLLLVDEESEAQARVEAVRDRIEGELGMTIRILDNHLKGEILRLEPKRPEDEYRAGVTGTFPIFLFYTRFGYQGTSTLRFVLTCIVARPDTPKHAHSKPNEPVFLPWDDKKTWA